jgi:hypothetical protein
MLPRQCHAWETNMRNLLAHSILALVVTIGSISIAAAADADPVVGTWKLNVLKSKFTAGAPLKSQTRIYSQSGDNISLVMNSVGADGKETMTTTTYQVGGLDFPIQGTADYDTVSGKKVDSHTAKFALKRGGKVVGNTTRVVSTDEKTLTVRTRLTGANGEKTSNVLVFDRQ